MLVLLQNLCNSFVEDTPLAANFRVIIIAQVSRNTISVHTMFFPFVILFNFKAVRSFAKPI